MKKVSFFKKLTQIVRLKCPECGEGNVFRKNKDSINFFPEMIETCEHCHHHYDREPGYFLGAMYASYGLAVFEGLSTFLLVYFFLPNISTFMTALIPAVVILLLSGMNYKMGRVIWMNLFPR
ncbi:MAG: DUF983 domain-containing protein [Bacteroidia bacterium]|nr:DUF983 domain-containing protein [Bacteroidia bacterium]